MSGVEKEPPRLDARVADSPLVSLRYHVDTWGADVDATLATLRRRLYDVRAQQATLVSDLRHNEDMRAHLLRDLSRYRPADVVRCLHEGLVLGEELARLDERSALVQRAVDRTAALRVTLRESAAALRELRPVTESLGDRAERLHHASRTVFGLAREEHEAMSREILGGPLQRLADAALEAELAEQCLRDGDAGGAQTHAAACRHIAEEATTTLEEVLDRLRPVRPGRGLVAALRSLVERRGLTEMTRVQVVGAERRLQPFEEVALYRVAEDALDNAVRHGRSRRIDIVLAYQPERVALLVKDDGDGFDVPATEARLGRTRGRGLLEMQGLAELTGSRVEVRSLVGAGTEVRLMLAARR